MKINPLHSYWLVIISSLCTAYYCSLAVVKQLTGQINRTWVDKTIQRWCAQLLKILDTQLIVVNPHHVVPSPHKATIIMCNHTSLYDIPLSYRTFPNHSIRMLAKKEIEKVPFMGKAMRAAEFPFIDRKNRAQAIQDLEKAKTLMKDGVMLWIAPEGTRSSNGKLGPFKKGAFITAIQAQAIIIPIGIRGAHEVLPARTFRYGTHQKVEVHIGAPIDASLYTIETKDELIQRTHTVMKELVGQTDHFH